MLPGGADYDSQAEEGALFHRDSAGKTCFSAAEARAATEHLETIRLEERVKAALQKKHFVLPQQSRNVEQGFCNEQLYGKMNLLSVSGVVRMDASGGAASNPSNETFDAWPSKEALNDPDRFRSAYDGEAEFYDGGFY